ncbi:hypothetical protein D9M70_489230 [compost metagenome]
MHGAQVGALDDLDVRRTLQALEILHGRAVCQVDFARKQRCDAGGGRGDRHEFDAVEIVLGRIPPAVVLDENRLAVWNAGFDLERAGTVGVVGGVAFDLGADVGRPLGLVVDQPVLVEHEDVGHVVEEQRVQRIHFDVDRVVVDLGGRDIGGDVAAQWRGRVADAGHGGNDVVSGEIGTVLELHALAQMEAPDLVLHHLPARGERRLDLKLRRIARQALIDVVEEGQVRGAAVGIGVERENIPRASPAQRFRGCGGCEDGKCQPREEMLSQFHVVPSVFSSVALCRRSRPLVSKPP